MEPAHNHRTEPCTKNYHCFRQQHKSETLCSFSLFDMKQRCFLLKQRCFNIFTLNPMTLTHISCSMYTRVPRKKKGKKGGIINNLQRA